MNARISVIIPNYNYGRFIGEAIESVLAQSYKPLELIVVDDGSTDDSVKTIERFGGKVKLIKQKNCGVGKARNVGAKNSSGDFLAFLDADDIWLPKKLEKQIEFFESNGESGLVTTGMREFDANRKIIFEHIEGKNGWCAKDLLLIKPTVVGPGSTSLVRRKIFEQINGFDERKEMHPSEDWEFCFRAAHIAKIGFIREVLVEYRNHGGNGHLQIPRYERSIVLAFEKVFNNPLPEIQSLKNQAYGNLHRILAGSYFQAGDYKQFIKHSIKSFRLTPASILYFMKFPFRRLRHMLIAKP